MKRQIAAPLLSGLVLPGSGQILNRQLVKGGILIGCVTVLFVLLFFQILNDLQRALQNISDPRLEPGLVAKLAAEMSGQDHGYLSFLVGALFVLWIYSIVDAFLCGRKLDGLKDETPGV